MDPVFINKVLRSLKPSWLRPWGKNMARLNACGGRKSLIEKVPGELKLVLDAGGDTTLMVWADLDDDMADGDQLKTIFWNEAQRQGITLEQFDRVVFIFAKDRIENWVEFLITGETDESREGPRLHHLSEAADAARILADRCLQGCPIPNIPTSLEWSCRNWRALVERMR